MIALLLALASFTTCLVGGFWAIGALSAGHLGGEDAPAPPAEPDDPWIARDGASTTGRHVWAGQTATGALRTPPDCAAIVVGPPKSGKTRKVIAPTLAAWAGPALVTSTKGDILKSAAHRARLGPVAVYDPTGSLGRPEVSVGFSPLSRCGSWDGAVEVAAALLSPASADESVRHGEHFAIAARALLAPLFHAAALSGGGIDRARGWLGRSEFSQPAEILRKADAQIALEELSGVAAQAVGDYRTSVLGTAQVALAWASRAAVRASTDPTLTPQIDLGELIALQGTLYVVSPSRIQEELAPLIAALLDGLCAHAIDLAITSRCAALEREDALLRAELEDYWGDSHSEWCQNEWPHEGLHRCRPSALIGASPAGPRSPSPLPIARAVRSSRADD
jgi:type IV secretory pathway TraG/TraD family ATPase VirD4